MIVETADLAQEFKRTESPRHEADEECYTIRWAGKLIRLVLRHYGRRHVQKSNSHSGRDCGFHFGRGMRKEDPHGIYACRANADFRRQ